MAGHDPFGPALGPQPPIPGDTGGPITDQLHQEFSGDGNRWTPRADAGFDGDGVSTTPGGNPMTWDDFLGAVGFPGEL